MAAGDRMDKGVAHFDNFSSNKSEPGSDFALRLHASPLKTSRPSFSSSLFDVADFLLAQTMIFAIEEINQNEDLLPGITLGYQIHDDCSSSSIASKAALALINGDEKSIEYPQCRGSSNVAAIVGCSLSTSSIATARAIGSFGIPLVSYFSTCFCLSDKREYPTFFRTISSDQYQSTILAELVKTFEWTWIGTIRSDDDYGNFGMQGFIENVGKFGVCIAYSESFDRTDPPEKIRRIVQMIKHSSTKVVVAFAHAEDMRILLNEIWRQNVTGIQWIGTEGWVTRNLLPPEESVVYLAGTIGLATRRIEVAGLRDYLRKIQPSIFPGNILLLNSLRRVNFTAKTGEAVYFDLNGDPVPKYEVVNLQTDLSDIVYIGYYDGSAPPGRELTVNIKDIEWSTTENTIPRAVCSENCPPGKRKVSQKGKPICCFDCTDCADGEISNATDSTDCIKCPSDYWSNQAKTQCVLKHVEFLSFREVLGIVLVTFSVIGSCFTLAIAAIFYWYRETPMVKANNSELSFLLLFALLLCFICSLAFIGEPSSWSCMLRRTAFGVVFVLSISCILGKTIIVVVAFKATLPNSNAMNWFGPSQQRLSVIMLTCLQGFVCIVWLSVSPPYPQKNMSYYRDIIILECGVGSLTAFCIVSTYIALLSIVCLVLAFFARKLPDSFNDAKYITFSMLIFGAVWITFIPAYVSSPGKYTVAVEAFAIWASSFGLLVCIFAPKCYIILLKPESNTKKQMMAKRTSL
ncbi:extracellular calcium-sensing receptor-like [Hemitrygon akajei]|uniref:extracellular calcium-sensing receptor-like n=1 Tax=Hemitrygon akajei TaxID=2704970 RepID=UPI003BF975DC